MRRGPLLALVGVVLLALSACDPAPPPQGARVIVYGDSIAKEAFGSGNLDFWAGRYQVTDHTSFMAVPCEFDGATSYDAATVPDVVVFNFSGNGGSFVDDCMNGTPPNLVWARYYNDLKAQISKFRNGHTRVVLVGGVYRPHTDYPGGNTSNETFAAMQALARDLGVAFVDGGKDITPYRAAYVSAPCLPYIEQGGNCGTAGPGANLIRDNEIEHLCPLPANALLGTCNMYASGSVRLALAIELGIEQSKVPA